MKKAVFSVILLVSCCLVFSGCIKNTPYITTINPAMTANIGTYNFTANTVVPSTLDTQGQQNELIDSVEVLYITGNSSDLVYPKDKIVLSISKFRWLTGISSIVRGEANAFYYHNGVKSSAIGGIVSVTKITTTTIIGYFSFTTSDGLNITNGTFTVGYP